MPDIRHLLQIAAPASTIFPLVSTARGFSQWWTADAREATAPQLGVELSFSGSDAVYRLRAETFLTDYFASCNTVWGELMLRLKAVAEGRAPGPLFAAGRVSP